jgi:hypothetical protein
VGAVSAIWRQKQSAIVIARDCATSYRRCHGKILI